MAIFNKAELEKIPADPYDAIMHLHGVFVRYTNPPNAPITEVYIEFEAILRELVKAHRLQIDLDIVNNPFKQNPKDTCHYAYESAYKAAKQHYLWRARVNFSATFAAHFSAESPIEICDEDIARIHDLTNELRKLISATPDLEDNHRERILKRLEAMQGEIHKRQSNLDRFTGTIVEVLALAERVGRAAAPWIVIAERLFRLFWNAQGIYYGLPSGSAPPSLKQAGDTVSDDAASKSP